MPGIWKAMPQALAPIRQRRPGTDLDGVVSPSLRVSPVRRLGLVLVTAVLMTAAACGSDGADETTTSTATADTSTTTSTVAPQSSTSAPGDAAAARSEFGVDLSSLEVPAAAAYDTYVLLEDDLQQVEVEVPTDWGDIDTRPANRDGTEIPGVWASTNLDQMTSGYSVPGVQLDLRTSQSTQDLVDLLNEDNATETNCTGPEVFDYDDGLFTGIAELWTDCGNDGAALLHVVGLRGGNDYVTAEVQMLTDADIDAAFHILESFTAVDSAGN